MTVKLIPKTPSAYEYPLLIKNILPTPLTYFPDREIVYRDKMTYTYVELNRRVQRLANTLEALGVKQGDTVAVMDWDSHRYLECFFAVPMMGAVLHTINIRLSPEQLIYTINHAEDDVILVNADFLPLLAAVKDQMKTVKKIVLLTDGEANPDTPVNLEGEYEAPAGRGRPITTSPISTKTPWPPPFIPPVRRACPRASTSATARSCCILTGSCPACVPTSPRQASIPGMFTCP
jgi:acyl-CoA synthetase (AMP-forming)/AMP-acid ligase II